jgi:hypothetical protein
MPVTKKRENQKRKTRKSFKTYSPEDYNSNDGMLTTVWGPIMWTYLHTMSFNYPVNPTSENKQQYRDFVLSLKNVLPCGKCRKNLVKNMKIHPLRMHHMKSRETFSRYIYELHEVVNKMLHKKSGLTYEMVRERYEHFRARCAPKQQEIVHENGCVVPLTGEKAKCVIQIVPQDKQCDTFQVDDKCIKKRIEFVGGTPQLYKP